ncbi:MAG: hypothetical protein IK016_03125 [Lachnospiraceae bacterium]|nr:hypothetical protein [Lachnospiraceae bacterium]
MSADVLLHRDAAGSDLEFVPFVSAEGEEQEFPLSAADMEQGSEPAGITRLLWLSILSAAVVAGGFILLIYGTERAPERRKSYG